MKLIKIRITGTSAPQAWYADKIGEEFDVEDEIFDEFGDGVLRYNLPDNIRCVRVLDCEKV